MPLSVEGASGVCAAGAAACPASVVAGACRSSSFCPRRLPASRPSGEPLFEIFSRAWDFAAPRLIDRRSYP